MKALRGLGIVLVVAFAATGLFFLKTAVDRASSEMRRDQLVRWNGDGNAPADTASTDTVGTASDPAVLSPPNPSAPPPASAVPDARAHVLAQEADLIARSVRPVVPPGTYTLSVGVPVRAIPGVGTAVSRYLPKDTKIVVVAETDDGWLQTEVEGVPGYVWSGYLDGARPN